MSPSFLRSPWPLRVVWLVQPLLLGPALADALGDHSRSVQVVGSVLAWGTWVVGVGALSILRSVMLTAVRLIVPGALPLAIWCSIGADRMGWAVAGLVSAAVALVLLGGPGVSDAFVNGSSYGTERRVALRVPLSLLALPVPLAWAVAATGFVTGPLLLAAEQWIAGVVATVVGLAVIVVVARQFHLLSRRWLVFVPAGLVVHDPLHLHDPVLFPRNLLAAVGPALEGAAEPDDVIDTTGGALGLVLEVRATEAMTVGIRRGRDKEERAGVHALLVTPTQPASTLEIVRDTRLPLG